MQWAHIRAALAPLPHDLWCVIARLFDALGRLYVQYEYTDTAMSCVKWHGTYTSGWVKPSISCIQLRPPHSSYHHPHWGFSFLPEQDTSLLVTPSRLANALQSTRCYNDDDDPMLCDGLAWKTWYAFHWHHFSWHARAALDKLRCGVDDTVLLPGYGSDNVWLLHDVEGLHAELQELLYRCRVRTGCNLSFI